MPSSHLASIIKLNEQKVNYWIDNGAQPTDTVRNLFKREGIYFKRNLKKKGLDETSIEEKIKIFEEGKKIKIVNDKAKKLKRREIKSKKRKEAKTKTENKE